MHLRWLSVILLALVAAGCKDSTAPPGPACTKSSDCTTGVCRNSGCTVVTCSGTTGCAAGESCMNGTCVVGAVGTPCQQSSDCGAGGGVCRNGTCTAEPCGANNTCKGDELCLNGQCKAPPKPSEGHTIAAGGSVSSSGKHIHIGLTGQGKAVGRSTSGQHQAVTGAVKTMGR